MTEQDLFAELVPCPCGNTPTKLYIEQNGQGDKWLTAAGNCCGAWQIEFRSNYNPPDSDIAKALAVVAWNDAPRGSI